MGAVPDHDPFDAVSTWPTEAVPLTLGGVTETGTATVEATVFEMTMVTLADTRLPLPGVGYAVTVRA